MTTPETLQLLIERKDAAIDAAIGALEHLPQDCLGGHEANHPEDESYFFRDELLAHLRAARQASGDSE